MDPFGKSLGGRRVSPLGFGARSLSVERAPDESTAVRTIHAALDAGITLIDTSPSYHQADRPVGQNELLVARALGATRGGGASTPVMVATKGGVHRDPDGTWYVDAHPDALRRAAESSLRRLGGDAIDLYQLHKPDPDVPYEESVGALIELTDRGVVRSIGISNVNATQAGSAAAILGPTLVSVQNQLSLLAHGDQAVLDFCDDRGIAFLAWGPLGGKAAAPGLLEHPTVVSIARAHGSTAAAVCLAWVLGRSPLVIPLVGATRPRTIRQTTREVGITLSAAETLALVDVTTVPES